MDSISAHDPQAETVFGDVSSQFVESLFETASKGARSSPGGPPKKHRPTPRCARAASVRRHLVILRDSLIATLRGSKILPPTAYSPSAGKARRELIWMEAPSSRHVESPE